MGPGRNENQEIAHDIAEIIVAKFLTILLNPSELKRAIADRNLFKNAMYEFKREPQASGSEQTIKRLREDQVPVHFDENGNFKEGSNAILHDEQRLNDDADFFLRQENISDWEEIIFTAAFFKIKDDAILQFISDQSITASEKIVAREYILEYLNLISANLKDSISLQPGSYYELNQATKDRLLNLPNQMAELRIQANKFIFFKKQVDEINALLIDLKKDIVNKSKNKISKNMSEIIAGLKPVDALTLKLLNDAIQAIINFKTNSELNSFIRVIVRNNFICKANQLPGKTGSTLFHLDQITRNTFPEHHRQHELETVEEHVSRPIDPVEFSNQLNLILGKMIAKKQTLSARITDQSSEQDNKINQSKITMMEDSINAITAYQQNPDRIALLKAVKKAILLDKKREKSGRFFHGSGGLLDDLHKLVVDNFKKQMPVIQSQLDETPEKDEYLLSVVEHIAARISWENRQLFLSIPAEELTMDSSDQPHIKAAGAFVRQLYEMIWHDILHHEKFEGRCRTLEKWLMVMTKTYHTGDMQTTLVINIALNNEKIDLLTTRQGKRPTAGLLTGISAPAETAFAILNIICESTQFRLAPYKGIPFLGDFTKSIERIEEQEIPQDDKIHAKRLLAKTFAEYQLALSSIEFTQTHPVFPLNDIELVKLEINNKISHLILKIELLRQADVIKNTRKIHSKVWEKIPKINANVRNPEAGKEILQAIQSATNAAANQQAAAAANPIDKPLASPANRFFHIAAESVEKKEDAPVNYAAATSVSPTKTGDSNS